MDQKQFFNNKLNNENKAVKNMKEKKKHKSIVIKKKSLLYFEESAAGAFYFEKIYIIFVALFVLIIQIWNKLPYIKCTLLIIIFHMHF